MFILLSGTGYGLDRFHSFISWCSAGYCYLCRFLDTRADIFPETLFCQLLCHSVGRRFQSSAWQAPVSSQRGSSIDLLAKTFRPHHRPLLYDLHWLHIPECIKFWLCSLLFRCLHGTEPSYLADSLRRTASAEGRHHLQFSITSSLVVSSTGRSALGDCAFPVAAARTWNELPAFVYIAPSLLTFCR